MCEGGNATTRGILMGLPLTWPILSTLNDFAGTLAANAAGIKGNCFSACGDDFVAAWTTGAQRTYYRVLDELGLKLNPTKTYESATGAVFVEELYSFKRVGDVSVNIPQPELTRSRPGRPTLFDFIPLHVRQKIGVKEPDMYRKIGYMQSRWHQRPTLSAILLAKRDGMVPRGEERMPIHLLLGDLLTGEWEASRKPWRKDAVMRLAFHKHRVPLLNMKKSGVPLYWPKSLGGWGLPGKQSAPRQFRKAAAVILNGRREIQKDFATIFKIATAPDFLRRRLRKQLKAVEVLGSPSPGPLSKPVPKDKVQSETVSRTMAYFALYPHRGEDRITHKSIGAIKTSIFRTISSTTRLWKSVQPMNCKKAVQLDRSYNEELVEASALDALLYHTGTKDKLPLIFGRNVEIDQKVNLPGKLTRLRKVMKLPKKEGPVGAEAQGSSAPEKVSQPVHPTPRLRDPYPELSDTRKLLADLKPKGQPKKPTKAKRGKSKGSRQPKSGPSSEDPRGRQRPARSRSLGLGTDG